MICNKAHDGKMKRLLFNVVMCLVLFNIVFVFSGCGLDTFYYIEEPYSEVKPEFGNSSPDTQVFKFSTKINNQPNGFKVIGTEVYYKIYSDDLELNNEINALVSGQKNTETSLADSLIENYKYQTLRLLNESNDLFIPDGYFSVEIRLTDYEKIYPSYVKIGNNIVGTPVRCFPLKKTFNFFKEKPETLPDSKSEPDVKKSETANVDGKWYIALFAVTKGHDSAYIPYYSKISFLGSVMIDSNKKYN